jgi:hypothetical protein
MHILKNIYASYLTPFIEALLLALLIIYATNPHLIHITAQILSANSSPIG